MRVFGFSGRSGSGKTTLIERVLPIMRRAGLAVSVVKHAHHGFDMDRPGKDSYRFREAGAVQVMVCSAQRWALLGELHDEPEPDLNALLGRMSACDIVLVEGFRAYVLPRIEVYRPSHAKGETPWAAQRSDIVAIASDELVDTTLPLLALNDAEGVTRFILHHLSKHAGARLHLSEPSIEHASAAMEQRR